MMAKIKRMNRPWRVNSLKPTEDFDEIVVSDWLHVEQMDTSHFFVQVGERRFDVFRKDGRTEVVEQ